MKNILIKLKKNAGTVILALVAILAFFALIVPPVAIGQDFGTIEPPAGVAEYQRQVGDGNIGVILFLSNMIRLVTVVAGIWTMLNFIMAGWIYISSAGDSSAGEKVSTKMTNSVIGLAIVALAYTLAGLVGYLIFDDPSYILKPELTTIAPSSP